MKKVVITQSGEVLLANGEIKVEVNNVVEDVTQGKHIQAGAILFLDDRAEINIAYEDGSFYSQTELEQSDSYDGGNGSLPDAAEIEYLQELILANEDPTTQLPETAAGTVAGNEGDSGFISVGRIGDETIAAAGYSTTGGAQVSFDTTDGINGSDVDEPSELENDTNTIAEDSVATGNVLDNDTDVDSELSVVGFEVDGSTYSAGTTVALEDGSLVLNADGSYLFTPNEDWNGSVPVITYTVNTGSSATLTIVVTPVDDASVLADDSNAIPEDTVATGNVLDNDSDIDNDLSVVSFEVDGSIYSAGTTVALEDGSLILNVDGSYLFTPNEDWNGTVPVITYTVNTGSSATLTIVVTPVDDASVLADDSNTIPEDTVATGNVLDNDSDIDNELSVVSFEVDGSTYSAGTTVALEDGSLELNVDGSYLFTPNEDWNGTVPVITYTVNTGSSATLTIVVTPVDDASMLADDSNSIPEDTVATGNVLDNDSDIDNDLSVVSFEVDGSSYSAGTTVILEDGTLLLNADGSYVFTPNDDWNGTVPVITYTVNTGSSADLNIIVTPVNDDFTDNNEFITIAEDSPEVGGNVIDGASVDGDITVTSFTIDGDNTTYQADGSDISIANVGTFSLDSQGNYTFTPTANYNGSVPVITYNLTDGSSGDSSTLSISVTPVNDDFTDNNEIRTLAEDSPQVGGNVIDGSSVDGDITVTSFTIAGDNTTYQADGSDISINNVGTFSLDSQGYYTFTPVADYNGSVPVITYYLTDGSSGDSSTLSLIVTPVSDGFSDNNEIRTLAEDSPEVDGNVIDGSSVDGNITVTSFTIAGDSTTYQADGNDISIANVGTFSLDSQGYYTFTPVADYNGSVPVITYNLTDGSSSDTSTLSIIVSPEADPFVDGDEAITIGEDSGVTSGTLLEGSSSVEGPLSIQTFSVAGHDYDFSGGNSVTVNLSEGELIINSDGGYSFTPATNYNGSVPVVNYTVNDGFTTNDSSLSITVTPEADPFVDGDEAITIGEDSGVTTGTLLEGSSSVEGPLSIQTFSVAGHDYDFSGGNSVTVKLSEGELIINSDGGYSFTPATNYNGSVPVVNYTVSDGFTTNDSSLSITVTPEADPFVDGDEAITIGEDSGVTTGTLLEGSSSIEGPLSIQTFSVAGHDYDFSGGNSVTVKLTEGELTIDNDGSYSFTPATNYNGSVPVVNYTVSDGFTTNDSSLSITVTPEADPFVDGDEAITIGEDSGVTSGTLLEGSSSIEGPLSIQTFSVAGHDYDFSGGNSVTVKLTEGELTIDSDGGYSFTPATNYNGSVPVVNYTVSDGFTTNDSSLSITVTPEADPFVDGDEAITIGEDSGVTSGTLLEGSSSIEGPLSIQSFSVDGQDYDFSGGNSVTVSLSEGELTIDSDGGYSFTPVTNYNGSVPVVDYTVSDGFTTNDSSLSITVTPEADPFVDGDETITIGEDSGVTSGTLLEGSSSVEGPLSIQSFSVDGQDYDFSAGNSVTVSLSEGELTIDSDGGYSFTPATNYNGSVPVVDYTVSDGFTTNDSTLKITVSPGNDKPAMSVITDAVVSEEGLPTGLTDNQGSSDTTDSVTASGVFTLQDIDGDTLSVTLSGPQGVTSAGQAVQWTWDADSQSLSGFIGTIGESDYQEVMTISLRAPAGNSSGDWAYDLTLKGAVDHPDGSTEDTLSLAIGVDVSDGNGGTTSGSFSVTVEDDAPEFSAVPAAEVTFNDIPDALIGETDLTHSSGVRGSLDFDGFTITGRGFTSATDSTLIDRPLKGSSQGIGVVSGGSPYLPLDNEVEFRQFADGSSASEEVIITLDPGTLAFGMNIEFSKMFGGELEVGVVEFYRDGELVTSQNFTSDANHGDYAANFEVLEGGFDSVVIRATDNGRPAEYGDNSDLTIKSIEFVGVETGEPIAYASGTVTPEWGADGAGSIELTGSDETGLVTSSGEAILITQSGNTLLGQTASGTVIFKLEFTPGTGQWDFHQYQDMKPTADGDIDFNVLITDGDGDSVQGEFAVKPKTSTPPETQEDRFDLTEGESINFNEATLLGNDADYDSGSLSVISLAVDGSGNGAIATTEQGASFTTALGGTVTINSDGSYSYQAPASLDHTGSDNLTDSFYYQSTDGIENSTWTKVTVNVADTAPVANDDTDSIGFGGTAHGNVITAAGSDGTGVDSLGADSASISSVSYKGSSYSNFDAEGNLTITTDDGILTINQDGNYSYQSTLNEFVNLDSGDLYVGNGVQLYGFNSSTDFVNGNNLDRSMLTGSGDGTYEYNNQVGAGNNEWIEYGESVVIDLEADFNEVLLGLNGWAGSASNAHGQWATYDSDGHLVDSGNFADSDSLNINSAQAYQYVVITADSGGYLSLTSLQTAVVHPLTSDEFEYVLTDADGDNSAATLTINQDSNPQGINDSATVSESGLSTGTNAGDGSNIATGNLLDNDSGISSSTQISEVEGVTAVNGVITVTTALGELTVYSQDSGDHRAGDYEYKLTANSTDGDNASESFDYTITNSLGSNDSASLTVKIDDDAPVAHDISQNLQANADVVTTNLTLVLDVSGSMGDPVGNGQTYLEVAIDALTALINEVDSTGNVNIQIVNFHGNTGSSGWMIDDVAGAINYLESLVAYGPTHYDAALNAVMNSGPLPDGADQSLLYFISDGSPSQGQEVDSTLQSTWESYLETSGYKTAFGIGIGDAGLSDLLPVAYPEVDGDEAYAVKLDDPEDLASTILNYFDGDTIKGSYSTGVVFGADGGHIESINVDGVIHSYDAGNPVQVFMTALGGKFTVNFDTGEYSYSIDVDRDVLNEHESLVAVVKDADGDTASVTLNLGVDYHANLDANSNNIITNLAEGTTIDIPVEYLLHGDKTAGNAGITQVTGDNVTLSDGVVTLSSTTEDSSFNYTLKGSTGQGEDSTHVDLDYAEQLIGTAENDIIINSSASRLTPDDGLITAIVTPGENSRVDNPFGFKFDSNSDDLSVTSISVNLRGGSDSDAFIENYALGDSIGLNPSNSIFTLSEGNSVITANFAEGEFTSGDEFWFTLDTSQLNSNDSNVFAHQGVTFTVTLSDGSEKTGVYLAYEGGAQTKLVFGDVLDGEAGDDVLVGGSGSDILLGGDGDDMMIGGLGDDMLRGGSGADTFIWSEGEEGTDHIADFNLNEDKLDLSDLLQGENSGNLDEYLNFSVDSATHSTIIDIDGDGDGVFEQHIVLDGVDLKAEFGSSDGQIINGLLGENGDGALIIDTQGDTAASLSSADGAVHSMDDEPVIHSIP
ncbi:retention module-containing protein [uncultured Shewanella sp.]|nr:retention module-containing protein [uncultured Shewanella sp.]